MEDQRPRRHPREVLGAARAVRYAAVVLNMFDIDGMDGACQKKHYRKQGWAQHLLFEELASGCAVFMEGFASPFGANEESKTSQL